MIISKEEKKYFKYYFDLIENEEHFEEMVYELYVNHEYEYRNIATIVRYNYREINVDEIIKILEKFNVKRCGRREDCKSPDGCAQSRDNFCSNRNTKDGKNSTCEYCQKFDKHFNYSDTSKQKHMLEFQNIREKENQDQFIVNLYKKGYTYHYLGSISLMGINYIISLLLKYDIKRCSNGKDCKSPDGCVQSRVNFSNSQNMNDGKYSECSYCFNFSVNFKRANQTKKEYMLEFQKIKDISKQDQFLVQIYKQEKYSYRDLITISLRTMQNIISLLEKYDIKRCTNPLCETPIQSRDNFSKDITTSDGRLNHCKFCIITYYNQFSNYDNFVQQINFVETVRRDPNNQELIQVQCKLCKEWFNPTNSQLKMRVNAINGDRISIGTENHLYCSEECKGLCPLYKTRVSELITQQRLKNNKLIENDFERMQFELRKYFLKIKNPDRCELCGEELDQKDLILHHIVPVTINNMFEADIDNLIFICQKCHNLSHQKDGCTIKQLSQISIENKLC
jgi:hypothetical protein